MKFLPDPVLVPYLLDGIEPATRFLAEHGSICALSVITRTEVLAGFDDDHVPLALELLDGFPALPSDHPRNRRPGGSPAACRALEALQAAIALHHRLALVTRNTKDFRMSGTLEVVVSYGV